MKATIHLCTYTINKNGAKMLTTRYSNWETVEFPNEKDARLYAQGVLSGLRFHWKSAAVTLSFEGGKEEYFTD